MKNIEIMKPVKLIFLFRTNSIKFKAGAKGLLLKSKVGIIKPQVIKIQGDIAAVKYKLVLKMLKYRRNLCSFFLSTSIQLKSLSNILNWANHETPVVTLA